MFETLLAAHISGAIIFALTLVGSGGVILSSRQQFYKIAALAIAIITAVEVASGVGLSVLTADSWLSICAKAGIYLALAGITETAIWYRARSQSLLLPAR